MNLIKGIQKIANGLETANWNDIAEGYYLLTGDEIDAPDKPSLSGYTPLDLAQMLVAELENPESNLVDNNIPSDEPSEEKVDSTVERKSARRNNVKSKPGRKPSKKNHKGKTGKKLQELMLAEAEEDVAAVANKITPKQLLAAKKAGIILTPFSKVDAVQRSEPTKQNISKSITCKHGHVYDEEAVFDIAGCPKCVRDGHIPLKERSTTRRRKG